MILTFRNPWNLFETDQATGCHCLARIHFVFRYRPEAFLIFRTDCYPNSTPLWAFHFFLDRLPVTSLLPDLDF